MVLYLGMVKFRPGDYRPHRFILLFSISLKIFVVAVIACNFEVYYEGSVVGRMGSKKHSTKADEKD